MKLTTLSFAVAFVQAVKNKAEADTAYGCGCGMAYEEVSVYPDGCENSANGATDSYGDGCEWYDNYPSGCGMYDTEDFSSYDMCCSCQPIVYPDGCENSNGDAVDEYGDGCFWYDWYPEDCGWYDTEEFSAIDMCCSCVGATGPQDLYPEGCENSTGGATDEWGDGCSWYDW